MKKKIQLQVTIENEKLKKEKMLTTPLTMKGDSNGPYALWIKVSSPNHVISSSL